MSENIKIDVIYYMVPSDFEMEFNLCGCSRMRLLTDKVNNRKDYVASLSRCVLRSRVIISCGPLFGEKGLIKTVSKATELGTEVIDSSKYNLTDENEFHILKGSIPLISSNGVFGGCIIENGPQTLVILTENKALRKDIMNELIHPYISGVSKLPEDIKVAEEESRTEEVDKPVETPAEVDKPADEPEKTDDNTFPDIDSIIGEIPEISAFEEIVPEPAQYVTGESAVNNEKSNDDGFVLVTDNNDDEKYGTQDISDDYADDFQIIYDDKKTEKFESPEERNRKYYMNMEADSVIELPDETDGFYETQNKLDMAIKLITIIMFLIIIAVFVFAFIAAGLNNMPFLTYIENALSPKSTAFISNFI